MARLSALEDDSAHANANLLAHDSGDEDFILREESDEGDEPSSANKRTKKKRVDGGMRKTRGMIADKTRGPKNLRDWIEEAELDELSTEPNYLTAVTGPPKTMAPRKFCSVCGSMSPYTCTRCGSRFCSVRCSIIHTDTRCLKFIS